MADTLFYTPRSGNSFKPALVLRQTGRACDLRPIDVLGGENRTPEFLRINPRGQVPYLVLGDGRGLGESNAIAWYLAEGSWLMPADPLARAQAIQWMIFEQTSLEPNISPARFFTHIAPQLRGEHTADLPRWLEQGNRALRLLDDFLRQRPFITDHGYSVADIAVFGYTHLAADGGFDLRRYPAVLDWMGRVRAKPGYADVDTLLQPCPDRTAP